MISHVLPMIVRAYDDSDPRIQEEVLRKSAFLAKQLDVQVTVTFCWKFLPSIFILLTDQDLVEMLVLL